MMSEQKTSSRDQECPLTARQQSSYWSAVDQVLISGVNFVSTLLLARALGPASFGQFTLIFGLLLFAGGLQAALVTQPHNVLGVARRGHDYLRYTSSTFIAQCVLTISLAALLIATWATVWLLGWQGHLLLLMALPALVGWQGQEFFRRVCYTEGRRRDAALLDGLAYGGQLVAITGLFWSGRLTAGNALLSLGGCWLFSASVGAVLLRNRLLAGPRRDDLRENWGFGKWLAGGHIVGEWLSAQLLVYIGAIFLGAVAAGVLRAVHGIFGPVRIIVQVLGSTLPTALARSLAEGGEGAFRRQLKSSLVRAMPPLTLYCLLAAIFARPLIVAAFGEEYRDYAPLLALYALSAWLSAVSAIGAMLLQSRSLTRQVFVAEVISVLIAPLAVPFISLWGVYAILLGILLGDCALILLQWIAYQRALSTKGRTQMADDREAEPASSAVSGNAPAMLECALAALKRAGIKHCILNGYADYPRAIQGDVDLLVQPGTSRADLARALNAPAVDPALRIVQWWKGGAEGIVLADFSATARAPRLLQLDICRDYDLGGHWLLQSGESILDRARQTETGLPVPSQRDEFSCYLAKRILKGSLSSEQAQRLNGLYTADAEGCLQTLKEQWSSHDAATIQTATSSDRWDTVRTQSKALKRRLMCKLVLRRPMWFAKSWIAGAARRLLRLVRPSNGLHVLFLGPDGVGKSSVISAVRADLEKAFLGSCCRSFPPRLLNRGKTNASTPHAVKARSPVASAARAIGYWLVYYVPGYFLTVHRELAQSKLVVHDRHLVDALVDPVRYRYRGPAWLLRGIWRAVPKPDMVILLDAPAEVVQQRKQEVPLAETARQREAYLTLVAAMPNANVVDAARPLDEVVADVSQRILKFLANRANGVTVASQPCLNKRETLPIALTVDA